MGTPDALEIQRCPGVPSMVPTGPWAKLMHNCESHLGEIFNCYEMFRSAEIAAQLGAWICAEEESTMEKFLQMNSKCLSGLQIS